MNLRKKLAALLAFVMAFSAIATFTVTASPYNFAPTAPWMEALAGEGAGEVATHTPATSGDFDAVAVPNAGYVANPATPYLYLVGGVLTTSDISTNGYLYYNPSNGSGYNVGAPADPTDYVDLTANPPVAVPATAYVNTTTNTFVNTAADIPTAHYVVFLDGTTTRVPNATTTYATLAAANNAIDGFVDAFNAAFTVVPAVVNPLTTGRAANNAFVLPAQGHGLLNATGPIAEVGRFPAGIATENGNEWLAATGANTAQNERGVFHGGLDLIIPAPVIYRAGISGVPGQPAWETIELTLDNGSWNFAARTPANSSVTSGQPLWAQSTTPIANRAYFNSPTQVPGTNVAMGSHGTSLSRVSATDNEWDIAFYLHVVNNSTIVIEFDARLVRQRTDAKDQNFLQIPLIVTRPAAAPQMQISFVNSLGVNVTPQTITAPVARTGLQNPSFLTGGTLTQTAGALSQVGERRINIPAANVAADLLAPVRLNDPVLAGFTLNIPSSLVFTAQNGAALHNFTLPTTTGVNGGQGGMRSGNADGYGFGANVISPTITIPQLTAMGVPANFPIFPSHTAAAAHLGLSVGNGTGINAPTVVTHANVNSNSDAVPNIVTNSNGVITNLTNNAAANRVNYAFLSHNGSRINIVTTGVDRTAPNLITTSGSILVTGLYVAQRTPLDPTWSPEGGFPITIGSALATGNTMGAFPDGSHTFNLNNFGSFAPQSVTMTTGTPTELIAGKTFEDNFVVTGTTARTAIVPEQLVGHVAQVTLRDTVGMQGGPIGATSSPLGLSLDRFSYTLTDADGYVLPEARIVGVRFNTPGINASGSGFGYGSGAQRLHAWYLNDGFGTVQSVNPVNNNVLNNNSAVHGSPIVQFATDGHSFSVGNVRHQTGAPIELVANIYISTAPGFDGTVYVTVASQFGDFSQTNPVATVASPISVDTSSNVLARGFHSTPVSDIVITENWYGALREDSILNVAIQQFVADTAQAGLLQINFWPINLNNVNITGDANNANRLGVSLRQNAMEASSSIGFETRNVSYGTASTLTLNNLAVSIGGSVPVGTYGLIVSGNAVQDNFNGAHGINYDTAVVGNIHQPNSPLFLRFGFEGFVFPNYIDLREVLHAGGARNVTVTWTPSGIFTADGNTVGFVNNAGQSITSINVAPGTLFAPMRAVIEAMGGTIIPVAGADGRIAQVITTLPDAPNTQVTWTIGQTAVAGGAVANVPYAPFIAVDGNNGGNPANNGTTYLPLRGIAYAHGLVLDAGTTASPQATVSFPTN